MTDSYGPDNCRDGRLVAGCAVTWGGISASVAGVVAAARRREATWSVPLFGALMAVLSFVFGLRLAESAAPSTVAAHTGREAEGAEVASCHFRHAALTFFIEEPTAVR